MTRYRASLVHFIISSIIVANIVAITALSWYPGALFSHTGGLHLSVILMIVDCLLGPLLTLVVYNKEKKSNTKDMVCLLSIQAIFLFYGTFSIYSSRPAYIAWVNNQFHLVKANEIESKHQEQAQAEFRSIGSFGPIFVATRQPLDTRINNDILFAELSGMGIQNLPNFYIPIKYKIDEICKTGISIGMLKGPTQRIAALRKFANSRNVRGHIVFHYLRYNTAILYVAINSKTGEILGIL